MQSSSADAQCRPTCFRRAPGRPSHRQHSAVRSVLQYKLSGSQPQQQPQQLTCFGGTINRCLLDVNAGAPWARADQAAAIGIVPAIASCVTAPDQSFTFSACSRSRSRPRRVPGGSCSVRWCRALVAAAAPVVLHSSLCGGGTVSAVPYFPSVVCGVDAIAGNATKCVGFCLFHRTGLTSARLLYSKCAQ